MNSTYKLTKYINTCISQQIFLIYMQLEQDTLISREHNNISENFGPNENDKFILKE